MAQCKCGSVQLGGWAGPGPGARVLLLFYLKSYHYELQGVLTMDQSILQKKAMLVTVNISILSGRKKDKKASESVAAEFGSDGKMGHYIKQSIAKEHLDRIQSNANEFRTFVYKHTLPFENKGARLLSVDLYAKLDEEQRKAAMEHEAGVIEFLDNYDGYIEEARRRLNGLFNIADYPDRDKLADKFNFAVSFAPVPVGQNLVVDIASEELGRLQADINARGQEALAGAMADVWDRVFQAVKRLQEKMLAEDRIDKRGNVKAPIFRDSIVENVRELVDILPGLNIAGDINLEKARQELERDLCDIDVGDLRESKESRSEVAQKAGDILNNLAGYLGGSDAGAGADSQAAGA